MNPRRSSFAQPTFVPLYPDEATLAIAILGPDRAHEWPAMAVILERRGLPPVRDLYGGRFYPAVVQFFRIQEGLDDDATSSTTMQQKRGGGRIRIVPLAPDGGDRADAEKTGDVRHRGFGRRVGRARA